MSLTVTMRVGGNVVELSHGGGPLPEAVARLVREELRYDHVTQLRGADAWDDAGNYTPTRIDTRLLYHDDGGKLLALAGWEGPLRRLLGGAGCQIDYRRVDPPHPRPDRYLVEWERLFERMDLRPRQDEMLGALEGVERGILHVPPAVGKTFMIGGYCLAHPNARVHVVTDGIDIIKRIEGHLTKFIPNVGMVGGGKKRFGPRVTVISADSLHVVAEGFDDPNSPRAADVVFFDEVHKAASPSVLTELRKYRHCRMYGLSANVGDRMDGADKQLTGLFGEVVYRLTYPQAQADGLVAPVVVEWVRMNFPSLPEWADMRGDELEKWAVWRNEERSRRLAARLAAFGPDEQVLLMVSKVEHAVRLRQFLPGFTLVYDQCKHYGDYVRGGLIDPDQDPPMTPRLRDRYRREFEDRRLLKAIATDVWSTGVDFVQLGVLARADARDSRIMDTQIPGRANRIHDDKPHALVLDCYDEYHDTLRGRSDGRKRWYVKQGWAQTGLATRRIGTRRPSRR